MECVMLLKFSSLTLCGRLMQKTDLITNDNSLEPLATQLYVNIHRALLFWGIRFFPWSGILLYCIVMQCQCRAVRCGLPSQCMTFAREKPSAETAQGHYPVTIHCPARLVAQRYHIIYYHYELANSTSTADLWTLFTWTCVLAPSWRLVLGSRTRERRRGGNEKVDMGGREVGGGGGREREGYKGRAYVYVREWESE